MPSKPKSGQRKPAEDGRLEVVVETPAGSRNKFAWEPKQRAFCLRKVLPAGMVFPCDFGFLPRTRGGDGDPLDVLLLMDEAAFPGCVIPARLIGVIEAEQTEDGRTMRNDRLLAVAEASHEYADLRSVDDLPKKWMDELSAFFVQYQRLEGREYRLLGVGDAHAAIKLLRRAGKGARGKA